MNTAYTRELKKKDRHLFELLPGYSCNSNCRFCSIDEAKRSINSNTEDLKRAVYKARQEGFKYLGIGGGEPTIRKDLIELIRFAKKIKFEIVRIETNGIALSYEEYCRKLTEAGLDFVKISIHGHKPEIHDYLTRVPGSFGNVLKAIENLQKLKVRIEINLVINRLNYKSLDKFIMFFANKGVGSFCLIYPMYTGLMAKYHKQVAVSIKKAAPYLKKALDLIDALELDKGLIFNIPPCCLPSKVKKMVEFSAFNTKVGAPDFNIGSIDFDRLKGKVKFKKCEKCFYFKDCEGAWADYVRLFGDKEFVPINERPRK